VVACLCDLRLERLADGTATHPGVGLAVDPAEVFADPSIDAVVLSTPVRTHYPLALPALQAGKNVFVEKPLASSVEEASRLVAEAEARGLVLMTGHVFVYTAAVRALRALVRSQHFGPLRHYHSVRVNAGTEQPDVDVVWDLAVHDLAILDFLVDEPPRAVSATGTGDLRDGLETAASVTVFFDSGALAHVDVNWLAPAKVRRTIVSGTGQSIVYDDTRRDAKLTVYPHAVDGSAGGAAATRPGRAWHPRLDTREALETELEEFVDAVTAGRPPVADGRAGLRVVRTLDAASRSLATGGRLVEICDG
jgi:predicted dehydrogenase